MFKKISIITLTTVLCIIFSAGVCLCDKIQVPVSNWKQIEFQGEISYISSVGDYIIVSERKVVLVDMRHNNKHYETNVLDVNGRAISFADLNKGMWVFVRGGILPDNTIGARSIYLLPDQLDEKKMKKEYPALKEMQKWGK